MEDIAERVRRIAAGKLDVEESKIADKARFIEDLHATSLDIVEFIMVLEDEFRIEISDTDAEGILTVGDVVRLVTNKVRVTVGA